MQLGYVARSEGFGLGFSSWTQKDRVVQDGMDSGMQLLANAGRKLSEGFVLGCWGEELPRVRSIESTNSEEQGGP